MSFGTSIHRRIYTSSRFDLLHYPAGTHPSPNVTYDASQMRPYSAHLFNATCLPVPAFWQADEKAHPEGRTERSVRSSQTCCRQLHPRVLTTVAYESDPLVDATIVIQQIVLFVVLERGTNFIGAPGSFLIETMASAVLHPD